MSAIRSRASQRLFFLRILKRAKVSIDQLLQVYCAIVRPVVEYACQAWHGGITGGQSDSLEEIQERALKIIMPNASYELACQIAEIPTLANRRRELCKKLFVEMQSPKHKLNHLLPSAKSNSHNVRHEKKYPLPKVTINRTKNSFVNWCLYNLQ